MPTRQPAATRVAALTNTRQKRRSAVGWCFHSLRAFRWRISSYGAAIVFVIALAVSGAASARPFPGEEYAGRTAAGGPVHFVVSPDRRVVEFTAGTVPGHCPGGDSTSFPAQFPTLVTPLHNDRFTSATDLVDTGTVGSYQGRLLPGGRAEGDVKISDRGDCAGSTTWAASASAPALIRLAGGPVLAGGGLAWVEPTGKELQVRLGSRLVHRLRLERGFDEQRVISLSGSSGALTVEREQDGDEGSQIYAGPPAGPLRELGFGCQSHPDADGSLVIAALPSSGCGGSSGPWRVVVRDVSRATTQTLFDHDPGWPPHGPELAKLAGRWVAWVDEGQIIVWDRTSPRGQLGTSPRGVYRVPADGVVAFDLDSDGTLITVRPTIHFADEGSYALDAFWPADPHPHRVATAATPYVRVAGGRKAYVAWHYRTPAAENPLVVGPVRGRDHTVAALFHSLASHRVRRLGAFDLDATRLAWAEQITVGGQKTTPPVRLVAVPVSGTPSGGAR